MRKITDTSINEEIKFTRIYRDDIEQIVDVLKECQDTVFIEIDDYVLDSIDEIEKIPQDVAKNVFIDAKNPNIRIQLSKYASKIYSLKPDYVGQGLAFKIKEIIVGRKNRFVEFANKIYSPLNLAVLLSGSILYFVGNISNALVKNIGFGLILLSMPIGIFGWVLILKLIKSEIYLCYRKDKPSFFKRNRDEILISAVSLVAGWAIGKFL